MPSHKHPPLGFAGWFAPGFSLFSLLARVVGRAQAVKQSRKKCGVIHKRLCILVLEVLCLRLGFPGAWSTGKPLVFWSSLEMRDEEPSVCWGRMAPAFQSPETRAALCPRPDSQERCQEQSHGGAGVEVPSHSFPSLLPPMGANWNSSSLAVPLVNLLLLASPQCPGPAQQDLPWQVAGRAASLWVGWHLGVLQQRSFLKDRPSAGSFL